MLHAVRLRALLLAVTVIVSLAGLSAGASAAPIVLPSAHPIATDSTIAPELVPPQKAKVWGARIGRGGHSPRRFPVELGGPSRRLSWHIRASGHAHWTFSVTCGTSRSRRASLGTAHRTFLLRNGHGRPRLRVLSGSFRSTRGFLPAHAPPPLAPARAAISREVDTPVARAR